MSNKVDTSQKLNKQKTVLVISEHLKRSTCFFLNSDFTVNVDACIANDKCIMMTQHNWRWTKKSFTDI